ncbi:hypothetical protein ACH42_14070 [Endozoicomonas sp. (ex Bugula neritina AB1)]|nr:hypothetical protein ACH42_14070 [Endozoicomonas sp. (ex Bugula neritina AB1)]
MKKEIYHQDLLKELNSVREKAVSSGDLKPVATTLYVVEQGGIPYQIRLLNTPREKPSGFNAAFDATKARPNPFLPYEDALYVGHLPTGHVILLNKYSVVDDHFLIVTSEFKPQESLLSLSEFEALHYSMQPTPLLVFFNSGRNAGASQPHCHLQGIPLTADLPVTSALNSGLTLPFPHQIIHFKQLPTPSTLYSQYLSMLELCGLYSNSSDTKPRAHNLLVTPEWMMVVPRKKKHHSNTPINALGFAGLILIKDEAQLAKIQQEGPTHLLANV